MTDIRSDIGPLAPEDIVALAERLQRERRRPPASFRDRLRGALAGRAPKARPPRLRAMVAGYAAAGAVLLALAALGASGAGPFGI